MASPPSKVMSDKSYLEMTDMTILLEELVRQVNQLKPENPWEYAATYFRKVDQCIHILGADYMTVVSCRYNRQAFIYCCAESLRHFPADQRFSVLDFYSLLQLVCPDIPLSLIQDSALTGCSAMVPAGDQSSSSAAATPMYLRHELSTSLFFRFIFTEWLIMLENLFFEGKTRTASVTVSPARLQAKFEEWAGGGEGGLAASTAQPSLASLRSVLADLTADKDRDRDRSTSGGISFDMLISALLRHRGVQDETTAFKPRTLVKSSIFRKHDAVGVGGAGKESESGNSGVFLSPGGADRGQGATSLSPPLDAKEGVPLSLSLPGI